DLRGAKVDGCAPGRRLILAEEAAGVLAEVVAVGAEVVVDHIHEYHQALGVGTVDQLPQLIGRAVTGLRGEREHAVVTPVALSRTLADRHQLDGGDTQFKQLRQPRLDAGKTTAGARMQFIDDRFMPGPALPLPALPD